MTQLDIPSTPQPTPPTYRLYSPAAIAWATVLGTSVAGGIVFALNYWRLGRKRHAWLSLLLGIVAAVVTVILACILPGDIPRTAFTIPTIFLALLLSKQLQGKAYDQHLAAGGQKASNWKGAGIGAAVLVLLGGPLLALWLSTGANLESFFDTENSVDLGHDQIVFYSRGASREAAAKLGEALQKAEYFDGRHPASVLLTGFGPDKAIGFVLADNAWNEPSTVQALQTITAHVADSIGGKPVTLRLLDTNLTEKKRLRVE